MCTGLVRNFNLADLILLVMTSLMNTMNCDFPLGRTGRVGNLGKATSFIDPEGDGDVMPKLVDMLTKVLVAKTPFKTPFLLSILIMLQVGVEVPEFLGEGGSGGDGGDDDEDWG